jgi:predicted transposase YbfD/YdcC
VTIDAIGPQSEIAAAILAKGADYLLALKANRPLLHAEAERFFADPDASVERFETVDAGHDRIEIRRAAVTHEVDWLWSDRRYPDEPRFPGLAALAMVEAEVERGSQKSCERRYFLSSARLDAETCARAARAHWSVENNLHWVLDVVFRDDEARLRTGHGPENMAVVKHMALNMLNNAPKKTSLKNQRKLAGWNSDYL